MCDITEYYTARHAQPLVVLPKLRLCYFKPVDNKAVERGYYIIGSRKKYRARLRFDKLDLILDDAIQMNGDFSFYDKPGYGMTFLTYSQSGAVDQHVTAWDFRWNDCLKALLKIQKCFKKKLALKRRKKELQGEYMKLSHHCFKKFPVRRVETDSFKKIGCIDGKLICV